MISWRFFADWGCWSMKETERLLRGQTKACLNRKSLVWPEKSFDPEGVYNIFSWRFPNKSLSLFLTPHHHHHHYPSALFLGKLLNQNRPRDRSFLCVELGPTLDSFTWCETLHGVLNLNIFYHNRIIPPRLSASLLPVFYLFIFLMR